MFFQKIKNFFKKNTNEEFQKAEIDLNQPKSEENNFESSQIEILSEPDKTESVIKKSKKRIAKYRK